MNLTSQKLNTPARSSNSIKILKTELQDERDILSIQQHLDSGRVLFLKTNEFFKRHDEDIVLLKNTFNQLKKMCINRGGSIGRLDDDLLVLSPFPEVKLF